MTDPWTNVFGQLANANGTGALRTSPERFNPNPAGVIRSGSATHQVLELFLANPGLWLSYATIAWRTGVGQKSLSWALIYLRSQRLIECTPGDGRNRRSLLYRHPHDGQHVPVRVSQKNEVESMVVPEDEERLSDGSS